MPISKKTFRMLRAILFQDWLLKIVCLVLATLYWFYIDGELTEEREIKVVVSMESIRLPSGMEWAEDLSDQVVRVKVRGPRRKLQFVGPENLRLDITGAVKNPQPGLNEARITPEMIAVEGAEGVDVTGLLGNVFPVKLGRVQTHTLPVRFQRVGDPRNGHKISDATYDPPEVKVSSLEDLSEVDAVRTEPINVAGRTQTFEETVGIVPFVMLNDQKVRIQCDTKVKVKVVIQRDQITRDLEGVPVVGLNPPGAAMSLEPNTARVSVQGAPEIIARLRPNDIRLYVEWPSEWPVQRPPDEPTPVKTVQVKVIAPAGVTVRGPGDGPLPSVKIKGAVSGALSKP